MSSAALVGVFAASAVVIWIAGIQLAKATDVLDDRLGLGSALGGVVLLAFATNLPEMTITVTAAISGHLDLAVGNLLGGVALQTMVLALLDLRSRGRPLTSRVGSLLTVLEASIVLATLAGAIMTTLMPAGTELGGVSPGSVAIAMLWLGGVLILNRARRGLPWRLEAPAATPARPAIEHASGEGTPSFPGRSTAFVAGVFAIASLATLGAGVAIEQSGNELAGRIGLTGAVFGATILAASTTLPEVSTGLASVRLGDYQLAFGDIFGGNAFLPALFLVADALAGQPALPSAQPSDLWIAGLGIVLTTVYVVGLVVRPPRKLGPLGPDSWAAVVFYILGVAGLVLVA